MDFEWILDGFGIDFEWILETEAQKSRKYRKIIIKTQNFH